MRVSLVEQAELTLSALSHSTAWCGGRADLNPAAREEDDGVFAWCVLHLHSSRCHLRLHT